MLTEHLTDTWQVSCKGRDVESFKLSILNNLEYRLAKGHIHVTRYDRFLSVAYAVAERLTERWILTQETYYKEKPKRVYYLSMEFLMGRTLGNALINLGLNEICEEALKELGYDLEELREEEVDAGLGNGGLGRLAACFLDSLATLGIPAHGYGIRYDYGLFHQKIVDGRQVETPDNWLAMPNPWEVARPEHVFKVRFGGWVDHRVDHDGVTRAYWRDSEEVLAMAYDTPTPGFDANNVNTLRLWTARATDEFNLDYFNSGDYISATEKKIYTENITKVLYPNDSRYTGKELRFKQEYFLVAASVQDIIRRFKFDHGTNWVALPDAIAIQLNDTHPALAIPEMMRILVDEEGVEWDNAWKLTTRVFSYTNHTLMPEALEEWPVALFERLLPRHLEIIYKINYEFLQQVARRYPGDVDRLRRMSLVNEDCGKNVRMAYMAVVASHTVNGVAQLHSKLMRETIFRDFAEFWPRKFTNVTNGITPRRWLRKANPQLSQLITDAIGEGWVKNLEELRRLEPFVDDPAFCDAWRAVKRGRKEKLSDLVYSETNTIILADSLFDVQVKRIHEYKRQLLFALYIVAHYLQIKEHPHQQFVPRTCLIGGKAAPGYAMAKLIIQFINRVADMVNRDPEVRNLLRVVFLPNYRVSLAEKLIPAADLSEQISTAGMEASGTGNMKLALNGAATIGTLDGANIEILEEVGPENIFIFGMTAEEVTELRKQGYRPQDVIAKSPLLQRVMHLLQVDFFCPGEPGLFRPIYNALLNGDYYCVLADFDAYQAAHASVEEAYRDTDRWTRLSILNVARCGKFSSDRSIADYARKIWAAKGVEIVHEEVRCNRCPLMS